jgi:hypothetical protein
MRKKREKKMLINSTQRSLHVNVYLAPLPRKEVSQEVMTIEKIGVLKKSEFWKITHLFLPSREGLGLFNRTSDCNSN